MRVFTPGEVARHATNKYLGVLVAAKYARMLNEFPRIGTARQREEATPARRGALGRRDSSTA